MLVTEAGNVGIGTTSPGAQLHVDSGNAVGIKIGPNDAWGRYLHLGLGSTGVQSEATVWATSGNLHLEPKDGFSTYLNYYSAGNVGLVLGGGNVGIGTTSPSERLHVNGNVVANGYLYVNGPTEGENIYLDGTADENVVLRSDGLTWAHHLYIAPWGGPGKRFEDVLIGGGGDPVNLQVTGDLQLDGSCIGGAYVESNLQTESERTAGGTDRFEEGDVLCWGLDQLELCSSANDRLVQAVADPQGRPIIIGAEVVKVIGPVRAGDYLVSSAVPGYAMTSPNPTFGIVIAQALEDFDGEMGLVKAMIRKM